MRREGKTVLQGASVPLGQSPWRVLEVLAVIHFGVAVRPDHSVTVRAPCSPAYVRKARSRACVQPCFVMLCVPSDTHSSIQIPGESCAAEAPCVRKSLTVPPSPHQRPRGRPDGSTTPADLLVHSTGCRPP